MHTQHRRDTIAFERTLYRDRRLEVTPSIVVIEGAFALPFTRPQVIRVDEIERVRRADCKSSGWRSKLRSKRKNRVVLDLRGGRGKHNIVADKPADAYRALSSVVN